ncbi:MAG: UPF0175 family protein [Acidobacteria bacterium]|nr:UPF0175 family protein [Acidobacteriota bacterium]
MQILLEVPEEIASQFAGKPGGVSRAALEALAVEGVRSGKLTVHQASNMLNIPSRYEMDGFLKAHGVFLPITLDDVVRDGETASAYAK